VVVAVGYRLRNGSPDPLASARVAFRSAAGRREEQ
jgi:hypothetical protein